MLNAIVSKRVDTLHKILNRAILSVQHIFNRIFLLVYDLFKALFGSDFCRFSEAVVDSHLPLQLVVQVIHLLIHDHLVPLDHVLKANLAVLHMHPLNFLHLWRNSRRIGGKDAPLHIHVTLL
mgnify:CR=1 FL=1